MTLRAATDADHDFMRRLYHDVRREEMAHFPFSPEEKIAFLDWQFSCQTSHYRQHYPACEWRIIEQDGRAVGRLLIDRRDAEIRIVDIAILSEARRRGIGSALITDILDEGRAAGKIVSIHVEGFNPALNLYRRLGFEHVDTSGVYHLMHWSPDRHA